MNRIKKAGIYIGAITGGILGGSIELVGKMTKVEFLDELGEGIVDSALLTGEIVGEAAGGTVNIIAGGISKDRDRVKEGSSDLAHAGKQVFHNAVTNFKLMAENSGEVVQGVLSKDKARTISAARTLAKMATIGAVTVGAIKLKKNDDKPNEIKGQP